MHDTNWSRNWHWEAHFDIDSNVLNAIVLIAVAGISLRYYLKKKRRKTS